MAVPQVTEWSAHSPRTVGSDPVLPLNPRRLSLPLSLSTAKKTIASQPGSSIGSTSTGSSLRSLRNLLPFGPAKQNLAPSSNGGGTSKGAFGSLASVRRKISGERKRSENSSLRQGREAEVSMVDIAASSGFPEGASISDKALPAISLADETVQSHTFSRSTRPLPPLPVQSPGPPLGTDLSTIIEADTSLLSNSANLLEPSRNEGSICFDQSFEPDQQRASTPTSDPLKGSADAEDVELSGIGTTQSRLAEEVLEAMIEKEWTAIQPWLNGVDGVIVDAPSNSSLSGHDPAGVDVDASLDLRSCHSGLTRIPRLSRTIKSRPSVSNGSDTMINLVDVDPEHQSTSHPNHHTQSSHHPLLTSSDTSLPSLVQRPSSSLQLKRQAKPLSARALSLPRSLHPNASTSYRTEAEGTSSSWSSAMTSTCDQERRSIDNLRPRQPQAPSPSFSANSRYQDPGRNPCRPYSRLLTSSRAQIPVSGKRPPLPRMVTLPLPDEGDADSNSPSAYTSSSQGTTTTMTTMTTPRLHLPSRPSLDSCTRPDIIDRDRSFLMRTRKRSMSVEVPRFYNGPASAPSLPTSTRASTSMSNNRPGTSFSGGRRSTDWLGPRTAKAFAAAGFLEVNKEHHGNHGTNTPRFGSLRSNNDREVWSRFTPSRLTFTDGPETLESLSRPNSVSHTPPASEAGTRLEESATFNNTPRTTFSRLSPAPNSSSNPSSSPQIIHATLQAMKEKHDTATEALLSALADSQRTTKVLREENEELRQHIQKLEDQLEAATNPRGYASPPPMPEDSYSPRRPRTSSDGLRRRPQSRSRTSSEPPLVMSERPSFSGHRDNVSSRKQHHKRISTSSSVLAPPPPDMSMLLHEEVFQARSPPRSPSISLEGSRHGHHKSLSSNLSISPKTTQFTASEATGSPGSLFLRPEHEVHLGDMTSLDLSFCATEEPPN